MSTYFAWGNYVHDANDIQLSVHKKAVFSKRGYLQAIKVMYGLSGALIQQDGDPSALNTKVLALEAAYAIESQPFGLYFDTGLTQPTAHTIALSQTIGGTRVSALDWANGDGTQGVSIRNYSITLECDLPGTETLLDFQETITVRGNGGPRNVVLENLTAYPQVQQVCAQTKVTATQRGKATGLFGWPAYPGPLWPSWLRNDMDERGKESPVFSRGNAWEYTSTWSYAFESPEPLNGVPHSAV